ncbi:MAG: DUF1015 domain-containing protein, partial [Anaerolineae bacterium]|nr:DUF1015 domain-containing protein [Anaerolineae bacterium]
MAVVKPFRSVRYNPARFAHMEVVVAQPYDRITDDLQQKYYELSDYNIARIIQGASEQGDDPLNPAGPNVYTRAKEAYQQWLVDGALIRDDEPVFLAYEQIFTVGDEEYQRMGLIAAVELVDFDAGVILPHEHTHAGPKEDRLRLLRTMEANTEQIFILYPDDENKVNALIRQAIGDREPDLDVVEIWESDVRQRVWIIRDAGILAEIEAELAPKRNLIIADGHHRYGTGLTYRDEMRAQHPEAPATAAFTFVQATLVSMDDPGLVVLPTHREVCNFDGSTPAEVLDRAQEAFAVLPAANLDACLQSVNAHPQGHAFGFYGGPDVGFYVLVLKTGTDLDVLIPNEASADWKGLAVSVLHKVLLEQVAKVPASGIDDKSMIRYHRDPQLAVSHVDSGGGNFVFFVSATQMDRIKAVAGQGEKMPQKSTDFYPKVISGLSML